MPESPNYNAVLKSLHEIRASTEGAKETVLAAAASAVLACVIVLALFAFAQPALAEAQPPRCAPTAKVCQLYGPGGYYFDATGHRGWVSEVERWMDRGQTIRVPAKDCSSACAIAAAFAVKRGMADIHPNAVFWPHVCNDLVWFSPWMPSRWVAAERTGRKFHWRNGRPAMLGRNPWWERCTR